MSYLAEDDIAILEGVRQHSGVFANHGAVPNLQEIKVHQIQAVDDHALSNLGTLQMTSHTISTAQWMHHSVGALQTTCPTISIA